MVDTKDLELSTDVVFEVPINEIFSDDDFNCRGRIVPLDVLDLVKSIQAIGLQQPIIIQPWNKQHGKKWRIVSGHRRFTACRIAELKTIKAIVKEGMDELTARKLNLEENLKRQSLNILQEAKAIEHFFKEGGWTEEMVMSQLNVSRGWLQARKRLLELDEDIQQEAAAGFLTQEHIKQLASMKNRKQREEAVRKIKDAKLAGEKGKIKIANKKPRNPFSKKPRDREEIFNFMEIVQDSCGNSFATRCLAWAAGEISDIELHRDLKDFAKTQGKIYALPKEMLERAGF